MVLASQPEHLTLSLVPKVKSVSWRSPPIFALHTVYRWRAMAARALMRQRPKRREWNQETIQSWGSVHAATSGPVFHSWAFGSLSNAVQHGDPSSLWFTNCFTNTSSPWEVWCIPSLPQLSWATEPNLPLFTTITEIFTEGEEPSLLSQCFIFKSTLCSSLFALNHVLLQGISPYSNGNCCHPINRRKVMWTAQRTLARPSYGAFTFSALFFKKYSLFGFVLFFPHILDIMWKTWIWETWSGIFQN